MTYTYFAAYACTVISVLNLIVMLSRLVIGLNETDKAKANAEYILASLSMFRTINFFVIACVLFEINSKIN